MSCYIGGAFLGLGWAAADTWFVGDDGRCTHGYRKLATTPNGLLVGSSLTALDFIATTLLACGSVDEMREILAEAQGDIAEIIAQSGAPARVRSHTMLHLVEPGAVISLNLQTGEVEHHGVTVSVGGPLGTEPEDFADLNAHYAQGLRSILARGHTPPNVLMREIIGLTARLYQQAFTRFGDKRTMDDRLEMAFVRSTGSGVEHFHLPAAPNTAPDPETLHSVPPDALSFGWSSPPVVVQ